MNETREEILISHVIDGDATPAQWRELETIAANDPLVWKRLAEAQRDAALLSAALNRATMVADRVELSALRYHGDEPAPVTHVRLNRFSAWTGWAVAAVIAIVASVRMMQMQQHGPSDSGASVHKASLSFDSAADAFKAYLDKGRESGQVVGEIPSRVLVETKPAPTGKGYEVIYLRQVMERAIVPDLYQVSAQDEAGRPALVRYQPPVRSSM